MALNWKHPWQGLCDQTCATARRNTRIYTETETLRVRTLARDPVTLGDHRLRVRDYLEGKTLSPECNTQSEFP